MGVISFERVKYAESFIPHSMIFPEGSSDKKRPIIFAIYLIKTENRVVLVDAGCDTMPNFDMRNFVSPSKAIEEFGVTEDSITDVIITHSHHDHIEATHHFRNAKIHIQTLEYEKGKKYIPEGFKVLLFEDEAVIDGCINVKKIGGHSVGSSVVEFVLKGKKYVICGDECYSRENLKLKIPTGSSICPKKSQAFIDKYSTDDYIALLCHDE